MPLDPLAPLRNPRVLDSPPALPPLLTPQGLLQALIKDGKADLPMGRRGEVVAALPEGKRGAVAAEVTALSAGKGGAAAAAAATTPLLPAAAAVVMTFGAGAALTALQLLGQWEEEE